MNPPPTPEMVVQVIAALYDPSNPAQQQNANKWLMEFSAMDAAWEVSVNLLGSGGTTEMQYFVANILLSKVRNDWHRLPSAAQDQLTGAIFGKLNALMAGAAPPLVIKRLCLVLSVAASFSGAEAATAYVTNALQLASQGHMLIAVGLLSSLAEEVEGAERARRQPLVAALNVHAKQVLNLVEALLTSTTVSAPGEALQCLHAWLKLDPRGGGSTVCTPGQLIVNHRNVFLATLGALSFDDEPAGETAVELLADIFTTSAVPDNPASEEEALEATVNTLLSLQGAALKEGEEEHARGLCRVGVAVAEPNAARLAAGYSGGLQLTAFMLACAQHPARAVVEITIDYFLNLNTVPLAERHANHQGELYTQLLQVMLRQAAYPSDFTSWEAHVGDDDADSFRRFREQVVADILDTAYTQLRATYLRCVGAHLQGTRTWQEAEAGVFAVTAVNLSLKQRLLTTRASDLALPEVAADQAECAAFLGALIRQLAAGGGAEAAGGLFAAHPAIMEARAALLGAYAQWMGNQKDGFPVTDVLSTLLAGLQVPGVWSHAANAFRNVCVRCAAQLQNVATLAPLIDAVERHLPPAPAAGAAPGASPNLEDRTAVVQGLARIIAALPAPDAAAAGTRLIAPLVQRAQTLVQLPAGTVAANVNPSQTQALSVELCLVATAVKFMDNVALEEGTRSPAIVMLEAVWPMLQAVAENAAWREAAPVVEAACEVYTSALRATKTAAAPLTPPLVQALVKMFETRPHPACLRVVSTVLEVFGRSAIAGGGSGGSASSNRSLEALDRQAAAAGPSHATTGVADPTVAGVLEAALSALCTAGIAAAMADPSDHELLAALFEMAHTATLFAPDLLCRSPAMAPLFHCGVRTVRHADLDAVRAAVKFTAVLLHPGDRAAATPVWQQCRASVDACVQQHGEELMGSCLLALADTCPRNQLRAVGSVIYTLLQAYPAPAQQWFMAVLRRPEFPSATPGGAVLPEEDRASIARIALAQPPLPRPRFEMLATDIAAICRREATSDVLIAHQM